MLLRKITVFHLINDLEFGGAEKILLDTISETQNEIDHRVICLSNNGAFKKTFEKRGIPVEVLTFRSLTNLLMFPRKNAVVHSHLYRSHLISAIFKILGFQIIWSIHSSFERAPNLLVRMVCILSYIIPTKVIFVSNFTKSIHENVGFSTSRSTVIYNGVNLEKFAGSAQKRTVFENGGELSICMVARYHKIKDFPRFAKIASCLLVHRPEAKFYLIGKGNNTKNKKLIDLLKKTGIWDSVSLVGEVSDTSEYYFRYDLLVSTSKAESFGLTVLEAALSGTSVSTINLPIMDELFGKLTCNEGNIDNESLAWRWIKKSEIAPLRELSELIKNLYGVEKMANNLKQVYLEILK